MKVIERIKEEMDQRKPWVEWDKDVALLVEYFEASEAYFIDQIIEIDENGKVHDPMARIKAVRAKLQENE